MSPGSSIPSINSATVTLRPFTLDDAATVQRLAGAFEIADMTLTIPHPYGDGVAESWIERHQAAYESRSGVTFAIEHRDAVVGAVSLMSIEANHQAELGYWIGVPYWGQGLCTAAGRLAVDFAFGEIELKRVYARVLSRNPASGRVLQKLGFVHEGSRRGHVMKWGKLEDVEDFGLMAHDASPVS